jgi:DNA polymerase elongation subunit (family B)
MQDYSKLSDIELISLREKYEFDIAKFNNFQLVRKIQLNSAYGAVGNEFFRYYSTELAEAVTLTGQLIIQYIAVQLNEFINDVLGTKNCDYIVYSDTDSVYINMEKIVDKFCKNRTDVEKVDYIDSICKKIMDPFIEKQFKKLASRMNAYENKITMEREVIADKGIWVAKKRYMLNVWDSEGIRYSNPKQKIMGIETTRSSTPELVRKKLKEAIHIILNKDESDLVDFVNEFKKEFFAMTPEQIAFPRSVNGLDKYKDKDQIYKKGTPIAVKGALLYNHYITKKNLGKKYNKIFEGEKIKFIYLKKPNPLAGYKGDDCVIAFPNKIPKEFGIEPFVDYSLQFEKTFIDPLTTILDTIGWSHEEKSTLESLFI